MSPNDYVGAHLVEVFASEKEPPSVRLFVAVALRENAVEAVRARIPSRWRAVLSSRVLNSDEVSALRLLPGEVREITVR